MDVYFKRSKAGTIAWGIACAVLGVIAITHPAEATLFLVQALGWILSIVGILALIFAFRTPGLVLSSIDLYLGILGTLIGTLILMSPGFFVSWIWVLIGLMLCANGFHMLFGANAARAVGIDGAGRAVVLSCAIIAFGMFSMILPFTMTSLAMSVGGVALIYTGIVNIVAGIQMPDNQ